MLLTEVNLLLGDASKARKQFGWQPRYTLVGSVKEMVYAGIEYLRRGNGVETFRVYDIKQV